MKRIKKIASVLLAVVMVLGMSLTAFAAGNYKITINKNAQDTNDHVYEAYQIFAGDLADNPEYATDKNKPQYILSNIKWGSGIVSETEDKSKGLLAALKADTQIGSRFTNVSDAAGVAEAIKGFESSTADTEKDIDVFAKIVGQYLTDTVAGESEAGGTEITGLTAGYYMVKDQDGQFTGNDNEDDVAFTRFLLQVVGDSTVNVKSEVPSGNKKIFYQGTDAYHNNGVFVPNPDAEYDEELNSANYASMGDKVTFQITSSVPNYLGYDYYYFIMNDTLAVGADGVNPGLKFDPNSVIVKVGEETLTAGQLGDDGNVVEGDNGQYYLYTQPTLTEGATFKIAFKDIMKFTIGANITVTYSATVTTNAIIGSTGNENAWSLDYSRDPNNGSGYGKDNDNPHPGLPDSTDREVIGSTPDHRTLTFLTGLNITKRANDQNGAFLPGTEFRLEGKSYNVVMAGGDQYVEATDGIYYKLADGTYTETPPEVDRYEESGTGAADTTVGYLKDQNGIYYVPTDTKEYEGKTLYRLVEGTEGQYADITKKYNKVSVSETSVVETPISQTLTVGTDGTISFNGLGEGTYTLTEIQTRAGYNTIDPINFTITCTLPETVTTGEETCTWAITGEGTEEWTLGNNGVYSATIINNSGALLPSTGGIGTTIFYVVGGILVIGAGILLVVKKRMGNR